MTALSEEWRQIVGFTGYEVSSLGRVRSWRNMRGNKASEPHNLKPSPVIGGYLGVTLSRGEYGQTCPRKKFTMHRLVALTFLWRKNDTDEVNHLDGNKTNNAVTNLEWCTSSENKRHAIATGLRTNFPTKRGTENGNSRLTDSLVRQIRSAAESGLLNHKQIAKQFNTSPSNVRCILRRATWRHVA